jgi:hypothetical protein
VYHLEAVVERLFSLTTSFKPFESEATLDPENG